MAVFFRGDAIKMMKQHIPTASVDLLYIDPPFGTTQQPWDNKIDWKAWFAEAFRVLKPAGTIVIHSSVPFNYELIRQAPRPPSHTWYWNKVNSTNPLIAKVQPLRCCEEILVWRNKKTTYYPQRVGTEERTFISQGASAYYGAVSAQPVQTVKGYYQTHYIEMKKKVDGFATRPRDLIQLMVNSYSKAGDTILDTFCYNGESRVCCSDRRWIGIDLIHIPKHLVQNNVAV